ncbi:MAG: amino acid ABC transporter permease [Tepidiformaceae bacterium]
MMLVFFISGLTDAVVSFGGFARDVIQILQDNPKQFRDGYLLTIELTILSMIFAIVLGAIVALLRTSDFWLLRFFSGAYVEAFRNTPLLLQLYFFFFALPKFPHFDLPLYGEVTWLLSPFQAGLIGLTLYTGAYTSEALRSGLISVDKGQNEASRSLGLTYLQTRRYVIVPQAVRIAIPLLTSIFSALFRNSALVSVIGVTELLQSADNIQQRNFLTFEAFTAAGLLYLALTLPLAWASSRLEQRVGRGR